MGLPASQDRHTQNTCLCVAHPIQPVESLCHSVQETQVEKSLPSWSQFSLLLARTRRPQSSQPLGCKRDESSRREGLESTRSLRREGPWARWRTHGQERGWGTWGQKRPGEPELCPHYGFCVAPVRCAGPPEPSAEHAGPRSPELPVGPRVGAVKPCSFTPLVLKSLGGCGKPGLEKRHVSGRLQSRLSWLAVSTRISTLGLRELYLPPS